MIDFTRLVARNITSDLWQVAHQKSLSKNLAEIVWFRWLQFWGTYQGYRHPGPVWQQLRKTFYFPRGIQSTSVQAAQNIEPVQCNQPD